MKVRPYGAEVLLHWICVTSRLAAATALILAMLTARPLLASFDQAFQYIQEFTGFFTPGIVVIFLLGMFWRRATTAAALLAAIGSAVLSLILKLLWPTLPFMDRVGLVFLLCLVLAVAASVLFPDSSSRVQVELRDIDYSTTATFKIGSVAIILILIDLYMTLW